MIEQGETDVKKIAEEVGTTEKYVRFVMSKAKKEQEPQQETTQEQPQEQEQETTTTVKKVETPQTVEEKVVFLNDFLNENTESEDEEEDIFRQRCENLSHMVVGVVELLTEYLTPQKPLTRKEKTFLFEAYLRYFLSKPQLVEKTPPEVEVIGATLIVLAPRMYEYIERKRKERLKSSSSLSS